MNAIHLTIQEFSNTAKNWRIWSMLAWQDIKLRYRRSTIGPFWLTISMAITIYSMGFLYGHLFKSNIQDYFPFLAAGMVTWGMIAAILNECTNVFMEGENFLRNLRLPYTVLIFRCILKNLIIFLHNIVAIIPIYFIFHVKISWHVLFIIPGILIVMLNGILFGSILGYLGTRYRDLAQIITSFIQVVFFLTPIMWMPEILPEKYHNFLLINPFFHFVNLMRNPLIGKNLSMTDFIVPLLVTGLGLLLFIYLFKYARNRLVFWL